MLRQQEMAYALGVAEYNQVIMDGFVPPNLVNHFSKIASEFQDERVIEIWEMVKYMSDIPSWHGSDIISSRASAQVHSDLIRQARKYLEEGYRPYMANVVSRYLPGAMRGGIPGTYPLVRSFVSVQVSSMTGLEDGVIDGQPVWPLIYYCLRCGDVAAALEVARRAESSLTEFSSVLESLVQAPDLSFGAGVEQRVKAQYRRYTRNTTDHYKIAVYCVVGLCDIRLRSCNIQDMTNEHPESIMSNDYLWFKLCQIRHEDNAENKGERMTYSQLQSLIWKECVESHYEANEHDRPVIYFQMLILTGQFAAAVSFLYRTPKFKVHGVHVAIALHELGLLADPPSILAHLLTVQEGDKPPARRLNFVQLISLYVRSFLTSDPKKALYYIYFLRDMANDSGENMLTVCVSDLVQQRREFDLVLGRIEADGCRSPGLIDSFKGLQQQTADIIRHVARECEAKGALEFAIHLYDLAYEHEKVLSIMNTLLTQVVTLVSKPGPLRARLHKNAADIVKRYRGRLTCATAHTTATFYLLLDLLAFFVQYHFDQHSQALETITRLGLLPFSKEEVTERVGNFKRLSNHVKRHFADILVIVMTILLGQYQASRGSDRPSAQLDKTSRKKHQTLTFIRDRARVLTNFARSLPYRMKGDTYSRLEQMEILMQ